jgi:glutaredoxin
MFGTIKILKEPVEDFVLKAIKSNQIAIFSKTYCPFCKRAKGLLRAHNLEFKSFELDEIENGGDIQGHLKDLTQQSTVPNIFIKGKHIGGSDKLAKAFEKGTIKDLFNH